MKEINIVFEFKSGFVTNRTWDIEKWKKLHSLYAIRSFYEDLEKLQGDVLEITTTYYFSRKPIRKVFKTFDKLMDYLLNLR